MLSDAFILAEDCYKQITAMLRRGYENHNPTIAQNKQKHELIPENDRCLNTPFFIQMLSV
jgi:hypothetical protein